MRRPIWIWLGLTVLFILLLGAILLGTPTLRDRILWRAEGALTYLRVWVKPVESIPTSLPKPRVMVTRQPTATLVPTSTPLTPEPTFTPIPTPTPIPGVVSLSSPAWEKQDINNCGPASLTMYLRYWGWDGDQFDISDQVKPNRKDRNVNVEELAFFAHNYTGWLNFEYRLGGDIDLLKQFLAAGLPVMVEEGVYLEATYWPKDDHWAAHYLLLTGYDDAAQTFTSQDSFFGPDRAVTYEQLDESWQIFNRVVILVYPPDRQAVVQAILGEDWDVTVNRQNALDDAQAEIDQDADNAFAWFNLGTNLVYFERYDEAVEAYDRAIVLGLPQRMLRYQFGPFIASFHSGNIEGLLALSENALGRTPNSEEALLWHGWGLYRQGKTSLALQDFYQALEHHPGYQDAQYAIDFVRQNP